MTSNEQLITSFFQAFQKKDYRVMQNSYSDVATFNDEVFVDLNADEVKAMWEMLCTRAKDFQLEFSNVKANDSNGSAEWKATYTFSKTNRKVINHVIANFEFVNGKITKHSDHFNFYKWASQALGLKGTLLGWSSFLKNKVRSGAKSNLVTFMNK